MYPPLDQFSEGEVVIGTCLVEFGEVNTNSPFAALLYQDWVGEPIKVVCLPDEIGSQQPVNFLAEGMASLRIHLSWLLLD